MRNLTAEAIILAEAEIIKFDPRLADEEYRRSLNPIEKRDLVNQLIILGEYFEDFLIQTI